MVSSDKAVLVAGIKKSFGEVAALSDVSFEVNRGEVLGLLGPNGAGKTTTVNILSTLITPDGGRASIAGHDVVSDPAGVRRSLMLTGQHVALDDLLTGRENLLMFGRLQGLKKKLARQRAHELLEQFDLLEAADRALRGQVVGLALHSRVTAACEHRHHLQRVLAPLSEELLLRQCLAALLGREPCQNRLRIHPSRTSPQAFIAPPWGATLKRAHCRGPAPGHPGKKAWTRVALER